MSSQGLAEGPTLSRGPAEDVLSGPFHLACFALCLAHVIWLAASYAIGVWLIGPDGLAVPNDFVNVWAAGKLVLDGAPASAYDWTIHKQVENAAVGYDFPGYYGWHYPPPFLVVAALLALLPYTAALLTWMVVTFPIYMATIRFIVGHRIGLLLAGAFPAALANVSAGQNGFLTASLIGGTLGLMQSHPILSGVCLGLLTYKPHFGILFPLVLAVAGYWRVFFTAALVGSVMAVISWLAYGTASWLAFAHWLPVTSKVFLSEGQAHFDKLQSLYGLVRAFGGSENLAWSLQLPLSAATAVTLCLVWRSRIAFDLKAAALALGTLVATPYLYLYDCVILAIPVAFLLRAAIVTGFRAGELTGLAIAAGFIFAFPFWRGPVALAALAIVAVLVARRAMQVDPGPALARATAAP